MPRGRKGKRSKSWAKGSRSVLTEMHHMRSGRHKIKSRKQAVAIGLSKARQKGARIPRKGRERKSA
jgi:hypothetical protein